MIDLWCNTVEGQIVVIETTVAILTGSKTDRSCTPERIRGDEEVLSPLMQVDALAAGRSFSVHSA